MFGRKSSTSGIQRISAAEHKIHRKSINHNASKIIKKLQESGYDAYIVGGCVRDLILGKEPKDCDVATNAEPEDVRRIFRNCRLIGRRFRLAHVYFGREIIEVATFRAGHEKGNAVDAQTRKGMITRDNVYGTLEDDAWRRDFSMNALYYDITDHSIIDYTGGFADLSKKHICMIGDAEQRYREDPVRMLRAIRFSSKLDLDIAPETVKPIQALGELLEIIPPSRLFEEVLKLFLSGYAVDTFHQLREQHLFERLFPQTEKHLQNESTLAFILHALENTDLRIKQEKSLNPAFLFAVFLWPPVNHLAHEYRQDAIHPLAALEQASYDVLKTQSTSVAIPRRHTMVMQEMWTMQIRFQRRQGKKPWRLIENKRFRAAYDFLLLRAEHEPHLQALAQWWTQFYDGDEEQRQELVEQLPQPKPRKRAKRAPAQ
tara:strand:- start:59097 stop:60386 length:1290 start_codon:yes stop_codon:yes gene_type:complete